MIMYHLINLKRQKYVGHVHNVTPKVIAANGRATGE